MKTLNLLIATVFTLIGSLASADQFQLNFIDTNDCAKAQNEVLLLNTPQVSVSAMCSAPGAYRSNNGKIYTYRLTTIVTTQSQLYPGMSFRLNDIDTNNCQWAQSEISILNTNQFSVYAECSNYIPGGYPSDNGRVYDYRLYTTVTVNY